MIVPLLGAKFAASHASPRLMPWSIGGVGGRRVVIFMRCLGA